MTREEYDSEEEHSPKYSPKSAQVTQLQQQYDSRNMPKLLSGKTAANKSSLTSKLFKGMSKGFKLR